jgi:uncharacterized protein YbjT (DUF2867 family)
MKVAVFGATGVAGSGVLEACLADPRVTEVVAPTRRPLGVQHAKLREVICPDLGDLGAARDALTGVDLCCYCLGISVSQAPDEAAYRHITLDLALHAARTLRETSPAHTFYFISGASTDARSWMMWARVKGETELALQREGLARVVCWRPGYIHREAPRAQLGASERVMRALYPLLRSLQGLSVEAVDIGRAMLQAHAEGEARQTLENGEIRRLAGRYARVAGGG